MPSFATYLGKGIQEVNYPYRSAMVFGAELNAVNTAGWTAPLTILSPTTAFDLSKLTPNHEVVVALLNLSNLLAGKHNVTFQWYLQRTGQRLYIYEYSFTPAAGQGWFVYSYIGYVPWEISENGGYRVDISVSGAASFAQSLYFTVTGIPLPAQLPEVIAEGVAGLVRTFELASAWCYSIYTTIYGWIWPFQLAAEPFYWLSLLFMKAATATSEWSGSLNLMWRLLASAISSDSLTLFINALFPTLRDVLTWFADWVTPITSTIVSWWETIQETVKGWIRAAVVGLGDLLTAWGIFVTDVLPNLPSLDTLTSWWDDRLADIQSLINSALTARESLWAGWDTMRDTVVAFFSNPLEFLWGLFADWFLGPEEE